VGEVTVEFSVDLVEVHPEAEVRSGVGHPSQVPVAVAQTIAVPVPHGLEESVLLVMTMQDLGLDEHFAVLVVLRSST
jgi:hypothetical protein